MCNYLRSLSPANSTLNLFHLHLSTLSDPFLVVILLVGGISAGGHRLPLRSPDLSPQAQHSPITNRPSPTCFFVFFFRLINPACSVFLEGFGRREEGPQVSRLGRGSRAPAASSKHTVHVGAEGSRHSTPPKLAAIAVRAREAVLSRQHAQAKMEGFF